LLLSQENILSDTDVACVAALCLEKENNRRVLKRVVQKETTSHIKISWQTTTFFFLSFFLSFFLFFWRFDHPLFDRILETATSTIAKEILICDKDLLAHSFYPLRYNIWPLIIHLNI
jgi:hypothetical protein